MTIVTSLLQCDTGLGLGTADHGVPDEVRRHRHHLPLPGLVTLHRRQQVEALGFVYRSAAVDGFGKPGKSAAAAAITLTTQGEMCI